MKCTPGHVIRMEDDEKLLLDNPSYSSWSLLLPQCDGALLVQTEMKSSSNRFLPIAIFNCSCTIDFHGEFALVQRRHSSTHSDQDDFQLPFLLLRLLLIATNLFVTNLLPYRFMYLLHTAAIAVQCNE